jgi:glycosyltransferase 2 family protein
MRRGVRLVATLVVTALAVGYLVWKIDIRETADVLAEANVGYVLASLAIMLGTVLPLAWRWQRLLAARGIHDELLWLFRAYLVSYTAGQLLPTAVGGDAVRIFETSRRHPGRTGDIAGSVLLERALGGAATLALAGVGFVLAVGRYDVGAYLWVELVFVLATVVFAVLFFSRAARRPLRRTVPLVQRIGLERPVRALYEGIHAYRAHGALLAGVTALTVGVQALRVLAIWLAAEAAGVDLGPRVYYVMGPLLFLVMLVPFTVNGFAVREAFFVSFLGSLGVDPDAAFAAGFLFFLVTVAMAVPGALILLVESVRGARVERAGLTAEPRWGSSVSAGQFRRPPGEARRAEGRRRKRAP